MKRCFSHKVKNCIKITILAIISFLFVNTALASHVHFSVGINAPGPVVYQTLPPPPVYYNQPAPYYPSAYPANYTVWVPDHWENGYWIPGHYAQYYAPQPQPVNYVWMNSYWDNYHHWHHAHWHRRDY